MATALCIFYFIILTYLGFKLLYTPKISLKVPFQKHNYMLCNGPETLLIFIFGTGLIGLMPVLSLRLVVLELLCILGIQRSKNNVIWSWPLKLYVFFLIWGLIGCLYTPSAEYGARMVLKYSYSLLLALFASSVVRDWLVLLKSLTVARWVAAFTILIYLIPVFLPLFPGVFWNRAALATHYITMSVMSLALYFFTNQKNKNLLFFIAFSLPCFLWVFRTDIMGLVAALSAFALIKYRLKAAPIIMLLGVLSVAALFYIPSLKSKMYYHPEEVTLTDFLSGNVDEDNINTSGRGPVWEDCKNWFYKDHELIGSGTGRVQKYMYTETTGFRRGGQIHNDFLVLMCDNGLIGLSLYLLSVISAFIHCIYVYHKRSYSPHVKFAAIVAGASLLGVVITMYSDNTLSYSMATLSYPWGLYGMTLGLLKSQKND